MITSKDFKKLKKLIKSGKTNEELATIFDCPFQKIYEVLNYNGTTLNKLRGLKPKIGIKTKKKKENKIVSVSAKVITCPAWITIKRNEWQAKMIATPKPADKAHITRHYKNEFGLDFPAILKEEAKALKKEFKIELKEKKKKGIDMPFKKLFRYTPKSEQLRLRVVELEAENSKLKKQLKEFV